jgi:phosphoribosylanthranilate isomerase
MLRTKVKAGAVSNLTDARYFAAREVEWLGFPLQPGVEDALTVNAAKTIIEWIDGVKIVGEFDFASADEILDAHRQLWFDAVQVGMFTGPEVLEQLKGLTIILEIVVGKETTGAELSALLSQYAASCDYFLLDFTKSGLSWESILQGAALPIDFLKNMVAQYPIIWSLDIVPGAVQQLLDELRPFGISLRGGMEEKTGFKSFEELDEILDQLEISA